MDMLELLYDRSFKGIPLLLISELLNDRDSHMLKAGSLFVKYNDKIIPLGCIKDIYADPQTGKKASIPNISNPCLNVRTIFDIVCSSQDCVSCHKIALDMAFANKLKLIKK